MTNPLTVDIEPDAPKGKKAKNPVAGAIEMPTQTGPKKVRMRRNTSGGPLDIPQELVDRLWANGIALQWCAFSINGDDKIARTNLQGFRMNGGWEVVTSDMFKVGGEGLLDGMFYPKGHKGEIEVGGQILHWRPRELEEQARADMAIKAQEPRKIAEQNWRKGQIQGVTMDTTSPNVRAVTRVETSYERPGSIPVPD